MPRRHRALAILAMPAAVVLWLIGWSLYWIGSTKQSRQNKPEPLNQIWLTVIETAPELIQEKTRQRVK